MNETKEYDCQECGACCDHRWSWGVLKKDRSDAKAIPTYMLHPTLPLMRTIGSRCCALIGTVGVKTSCSIYQDRPQACQKFKAGSTLCLEARKAKGFEI